MVIVAFPFTDMATTKQRPALVVSPDSLLDSTEDVILVAISSQVSAASHTEISVPPQEIACGGLLKTSVIRTPKIVTMHRDLVRKRIGGFSSEFSARVLDGIRKMFEP